MAQQTNVQTSGTLAQIARGILNEIVDFDRQCRETEYTDTDTVWNMLDRWRQDLTASFASGDAVLSLPDELATNILDLLDQDIDELRKHPIDGDALERSERCQQLINEQWPPLPSEADQDRGDEDDENPFHPESPEGRAWRDGDRSFVETADD